MSRRKLPIKTVVEVNESGVRSTRYLQKGKPIAVTAMHLTRFFDDEQWETFDLVESGARMGEGPDWLVLRKQSDPETGTFLLTTLHNIPDVGVACLVNGKWLLVSAEGVDGYQNLFTRVQERNALLGIVEPAVCPECGTIFFPARAGQQYDSRLCADRAGHRRRRQEKKQREATH